MFHIFRPTDGLEIIPTPFMDVFMHSTPQKLSFGVLHMHVDRIITIFKICLLELVIFDTFRTSKGQEIKYSSCLRTYTHSTPQDLSFDVLHMQVDPIITIFKNYPYERRRPFCF